MNRQALRLTLMWPVPIVAGVILAVAWMPGQAPDWQHVPPKKIDLPAVDIIQPLSAERFPPGAGSEIANAQCLICHSSSTVTRQPPLTEREWAAISNKMRLSYGAPIPENQIDALARYLYGINGREPGKAPSIVTCAAAEAAP